MSRKFKIDKMICRNCIHYGAYGSIRSVADVCGVHNKLTRANDSFCTYYQSGDLSHSDMSYKRLIDANSQYRLTRSKRR